MDIDEVKYIDSESRIVDAKDLRQDGFDQTASFVYPPCKISGESSFPKGVLGASSWSASC
jgi:hypothetical protein